ncbi:RNA polymerase sigma factor [Pendulispora albinea]|uniref:RNA polymerase sigma factor n=1 Tax=Pendulispora albinea TaxID=2741071 RepID=A0ABZ2LTJ8_9BACT
MSAPDEPLGSLSLEELAARGLAGDRAAVEALCAALQGPMYRLAQRMLGNPQDAEDCTQEILVQIVTHLAQFRGDGSLLRWAYTIASRRLLRARLSRAESRPLPIDDVARVIDLGVAATYDVTALAAEETKLLARDVQRTCTQAMLLCLTREERLAALLAEMLGATDTAGAEICGIQPDAFRQRVARARAKLRPLLEERCGLAGPANACRCERGVIAKQRAGMRLPVYQDGTEDEARWRRAHEQLGAMRRLGSVFTVSPLPAARAKLWATLLARFPDLLA